MRASCALPEARFVLACEISCDTGVSAGMSEGDIDAAAKGIDERQRAPRARLGIRSIMLMVCIAEKEWMEDVVLSGSDRCLMPTG